MESEVQTNIGIDQLNSNENKRNLFTWAIFVLVLFSLIGLSYATYTINKQNNEIVDLNNKYDQLKTMSGKLNDAYNRIDVINFEHIVDQGVVSDDLIVNKSVLKTDAGGLTGIIDISLQPKTQLKYKGEGKFDLQDRELKSMLLTLMEQYGTQYQTFSKSVNVPSWDTANIQLTVQNYDVGTYSSGKITLKGE